MELVQNLLLILSRYRRDVVGGIDGTQAGVTEVGVPIEGEEDDAELGGYRADVSENCFADRLVEGAVRLGEEGAGVCIISIQLLLDGGAAVGRAVGGGVGPGRAGSRRGHIILIIYLSVALLL